MKRKVLGGVLLAVLATACAGAGPSTQPEARWFAFKSRPPKVRGCEFDVFEDLKPARPHVLIGRLPMEISDYVGARGRKALLADTACESGADAVYLPPPSERSLAEGQRVREYLAHFLVWTDTPQAPLSDDDLPPLIVREGPQPTAEDGYIVVPVGPEWPEGSIGVETRSPASQ